MRRLLVGLVVAVAAAAVVAVVVSDRQAPPASPPPTAGSQPPDAVPAQPTAPAETLSPCPVPGRVSLTVLTLNVHAARTKAGRLDLSRVASELRAWRPDVALLQEIDRGRRRSDLVHQARWLGRRLGMEVAFGGNNRARPGISGNAVLSRHPILSSRNRRLPRHPGRYRRGLLRATLDVSGREVDVFSTHLDHASPRLRREQTRAVLARVLRSRRPVVLGGDINTQPDTPPVRWIEQAGLVDAWAAAGRGDGLTVPAYAPRRRIDFVFSDESFRTVAADVLLSSISDHRGVRAELALLPAACG